MPPAWMSPARTCRVSLLVLVLAACADTGRPAAFQVKRASRDSCPGKVPASTVCFLVVVQNQGGVARRATCSLGHYRQGVPGPTSTGEAVTTREIVPEQTIEVHLAMEWEPKKGYARVPRLRARPAY